MPPQKKKPQLKIVFDTNALYTKAASDLLNEEVASLIQSTKHNDIEIIWYLPEVVRHERQYQMQRKAFELLPAIQKLEKLLGHALGFTKSALEQRVQETVESNIKSFNLQVLPIENEKVDWRALMMASAYRQPPFDDGEKEKGFRDALVAESFLQLVGTSPATPKVCRIVLVTNDKLLSNAITNRTEGKSNVRVLGTTDELKGFINTISSEVGEEFIKAISDNAEKLFFTKENIESLIIKEGIRGEVESKFAEALTSLPEGTSLRENGTWYVYSPQFIEKKGMRISWSTRIEVEAKAFKFIKTIPIPSLGTHVSQPGFLQSHWSPTSQPPLTGLLGLGLTIPMTDEQKQRQFGFGFEGAINTEKTLTKIGRVFFEVKWSVQVSHSKKISAPKIEGINYLETIWNDAGPSLDIIR